jgi:hypothetical protein
MWSIYCYDISFDMNLPILPRIIKSNWIIPHIILPDVPSSKSPINWSKISHWFLSFLYQIIFNLPAHIVVLSNGTNGKSKVDVEGSGIGDVNWISVCIIIYD